MCGTNLAMFLGRLKWHERAILIWMLYVTNVTLILALWNYDMRFIQRSDVPHPTPTKTGRTYLAYGPANFSALDTRASLVLVERYSNFLKRQIHDCKLHVDRKEKSEKRRTKKDKKKRINERRKKHDKTEQRFGISFTLSGLRQVAYNPYKTGFLTWKQLQCQGFL